jgi:hypothetical protein
MLIVVHILLAIFVGWLGRHKHIGFVGFLIVSLPETPLIALLILMMTHDRRPSTYC